MTKREICERLIDILVQRGGYEDHIDVYQDLRSLILDLAAPEEDAPKAEEKAEPKCPKCGGPLCQHNLEKGPYLFCHICKDYVFAPVKPKRAEEASK
jgi:hypothetical protein